MSAQDVRAGSAFVELMLKDEKFTSGLQKARGRLVSFAAAIVSLGGVVTLARTAINAMIAPIKNVLDLGDSMQKLSDRTGLTVESLSELKHAASQSDVSFNQLTRAFREMQDKGLDPAKFDEYAASIAAIEDPTRRAEAAMDIWGKTAGSALLPMLKDLPALRQEARDLGFVLGGETAQSAVRVGDMFANLWETIKQGSVAIGSAMLPLLETALPAVQYFATHALTAIQGYADFVRSATAIATGYAASAWQALFEYVSPLISAFRATVADVFSSIQSAVVMAMNAVSETVGKVWEYVASATSGVMAWLQSTVLSVLSAINFAWNNWAIVLQTAATSAQLAVVRFANQTVHFFSIVLPTWLSWFADNWRDVFTDIATMTTTVAGNIWENLKNLWDAIVSLFSGEGFQFTWTPLTEGFKSAIKELPQIAEREIGPLEKSLNDEMSKLGEQLVSQWEDHSEKFAAKIKKFAPIDPVRAIAEQQEAAARRRGDALNSVTPRAGATQDSVFASFSSAALEAAGQGGMDGGFDKVVNAIKDSDKSRAIQHAQLLYEARHGGARYIQ